MPPGREMIPMIRIRSLSAAPLLVLLGGCSGGADLSGPPVGQSHLIAGSPSLVQEVAVTMEGQGFRIQSTLRNAGEEVVEIRARTCFLRSEDLRGETSGLMIDEPLILCSADAVTLTLDPGEASEPLLLKGAVLSGGVHEVELRHALDPEGWAPVTLGRGGP